MIYLWGKWISRNTKVSILFVFFICLVCRATLFKEACKEEGDNEYRKGEYNYAIVCYTEGINKSCNTGTNVNAKLFTNRAKAHLQLGENCSLFSSGCAVIFVNLALHIYLWFVSFRFKFVTDLDAHLFKKDLNLAGHYQEALSDAESGRKLQPAYMKAIETGNCQNLL